MRLGICFCLTMLFSIMALSINCGVCAENNDNTGRGLAGFFHKISAGHQVTVVAIGGSITMHTTGWALKTADILRKNYPRSSIKFVNAGVSGTGSNLGVFRLSRDVLAHNPDLVFVEYAVNDGGASDEACIRNLESIVVRLLSAKNPPAVVFVESAAKTVANHKRHNLVASHYNLLNVDMQKAADDYLKANGKEWDFLFGDNVHPNNVGHQLYAQTLWTALSAYINHTNTVYPLVKDIVALSKDKLVLDGVLLTPNYQIDGWSYKAEKLNGWWRAFFEGSMQSSLNSGTLNMPFYGRTLGLWLLVKNGAGSVRVVVDGKLISEVSAFRPDWYYSAYVNSELLADEWHALSIIPMGVGDTPASVRIGYFLLSDQTKAPAIDGDFWIGRWKDNINSIESYKKVVWRAVPVDKWQVLGAFGLKSDKPWTEPLKWINNDYGVVLDKAPDSAHNFKTAEGVDVSWRKAVGDNGWVDLKKMYNSRNHGIAYLYTRLNAAEAGEYDLNIAADYFVRCYVNGQEACNLLDGHGSPLKPVVRRVKLNKGGNDIYFKVMAGSMGFGFLLELPVDKGLTVVE